jgi:hypothetical protein
LPPDLNNDTSLLAFDLAFEICCGHAEERFDGGLWADVRSRWPKKKYEYSMYSVKEDYEVDWMRIAVTPCRSASTGLKVLFGCLILCLLACISASAQEENVTWVGGDLYNYAEFGFAVPKEIEDQVEAVSIGENNYSEGRYVTSSLLFNESTVYILLLYPCDTLGGELSDNDLKSAIESFNPRMNQTVYITTPLYISDRPAIGGQAPPPLDNFAFYAYQPSNQTISMIFIDLNVTEDFLEYFPESLQISVNESASPLWSGYCAGGEEEGAAEAVAQPEQTGGMEQTNVTEQTGEPEEIAETNQSEGTAPEFNKEEMEADLKAIEEKMEALKRW